MSSNDGAAYLYLGGLSGLGGPAGSSLSPHQSLTGPAGAGGWFGVSVASAGDIDGDGFADFVVGASRVSSFDGAAYVYLGGPSGLGGPTGSSLTADPTLTGPAGAGGNFGLSVAGGAF